MSQHTIWICDSSDVHEQYPIWATDMRFLPEASGKKRMSVAQIGNYICTFEESQIRKPQGPFFA